MSENIDSISADLRTAPTEFLFDHGNAPCPCCGGEAWQPGPRIPCWPNLVDPAGPRLRECAGCGTAHLPAIKLQKHTDRLPVTGAPGDAATHRQKARAALEGTLPELKTHLGDRGENALVIGCSTGFELQTLLDGPVRFRTIDGLDPNVQAIRQAQETFAAEPRVCLIQGYVEDVIRTDYDFVWATMVWEHIPEPDRALRHICEHQREGGLIALQVPRYDNIFPRFLRGRTWFGIMDAHLWYYSAKGMRALVQRAGYEVLCLRNAPRVATPRFAAARLARAVQRLAAPRRTSGTGAGSEEHEADNAVPLAPPRERAEQGRHPWCLRIGLFRDAMTVVARKRRTRPGA